jgi:RNA polymerase sigma factor (sigma-70 family)
VFAVDDRRLALGLAGADPYDLERVYRAYAAALHTYCRDLVRDPGAAVDVMRDTFVLASARASGLREPERLRAWLYAIARHECLRVRRGRVRPVPHGEAEEPDPAGEPEVDPITGLPIAEVMELVWAAASTLRPGDREAFELAVRHQLPIPDLEPLLEVSSSEVQARLTRGRAQLERALRTLVVARTGARECPQLAGLRAGRDAELTGLDHRRIGRHIESCDTCTKLSQRQPRPASLVSGFATAPYLAAPDLLWPRLELNCFDPGLEPEREAILRRAGRFDPATGFPRPLGGRRRHRRRLAVAVLAATAVALLAAATAALIPDQPADQPDPPAVAAPGTPPDAPPASPTTTPSATADPTPTVAPVPTAAAEEATVPLPPPESTAPARPPTSLTLEAGLEVRCVVGGLLGYTLAVTATANQRLETAKLFVATGGETDSYDMAVDGSGASVETELMIDPEFEWWVAASGGNGQASQTEPARVTLPCG